MQNRRNSSKIHEFEVVGEAHRITPKAKTRALYSFIFAVLML
jgi:hypothetical protein